MGGIPHRELRIGKLLKFSVTPNSPNTHCLVHALLSQRPSDTFLGSKGVQSMYLFHRRKGTNGQ